MDPGCMGSGCICVACTSSRCMCITGRTCCCRWPCWARDAFFPWRLCRRGVCDSGGGEGCGGNCLGDCCSASSRRARCKRRSACMRERGKERRKPWLSNASDMRRSQSKHPACSSWMAQRSSCWSVQARRRGCAMRNSARPMRWSTLQPSRRKASHTRNVVSMGNELAKTATNQRVANNSATTPCFCNCLETRGNLVLTSSLNTACSVRNPRRVGE
mmetsp:Transcript_39358/g.78670  ORF Transcript_39358/g.78670 Transcript_39358/m.78670 type:complete len:216 (-) Transcript_39358:334-981(-)